MQTITRYTGFAAALALAGCTAADRHDRAVQVLETVEVFDVELYSMDNYPIPVSYVSIIDEPGHWLADVDYDGDAYTLELTVANPDAATDSGLFDLADTSLVVTHLGTGATLHADTTGSGYTTTITRDGVATTVTDQDDPALVALAEDSITEGLVAVSELPSEVELFEEEEPAPDYVAYGGKKKKPRHRRPRTPRNPKPSPGTRPRATRAAQIGAVAGVVAITAGLCVAEANHCLGPVKFHCPGDPDFEDPCGCGPRICNRCWGNCASTCTPGDPCPQPAGNPPPPVGQP